MLIIVIQVTQTNPEKVHKKVETHTQVSNTHDTQLITSIQKTQTLYESTKDNQDEDILPDIKDNTKVSFFV